jgi:hypothetical protein
MVYNCVYYCDTYYMLPAVFLYPRRLSCVVCVMCIGVVSVYMQYNCVYYCDTCYLGHLLLVVHLLLLFRGGLRPRCARCDRLGGGLRGGGGGGFRGPVAATAAAHTTHTTRTTTAPTAR